MKYLKIIFLLSFLGLGYLIFHNFSRLKQLESPYNLYGDLIKGTYRVGYVDLDAEYRIDQLEIKGSIPEWLTGTLLRNGPAKFRCGNSVVTNWLDGLAMLHAFSFDKGRVSYANKFLRTDAYTAVKETGKMSYVGFAQDPCRSIFKKLFTYFIPFKQEWPSVPNANVNISKLANDYVAITEIPLPIAFDPVTLETLGLIHYNDQFPESKIHESVHPHYDPVNKEHLGFLTKFGRLSSHNVYFIKDGTTQRQLIASIGVEKPSYMHSFAITPRYIILSLIPLVVNPLDLLIKNKPFIKNFKWKPELGTKFAVIDRINKKVLGLFKTDPFFTFHNVNAYEQDNKIILDIVVYDTPSQIDVFNLSNVLAPRERFLAQNAQSEGIYSTKISNPILTRFVVDLDKQEVSSNRISDKMIELPRINYELYNGKYYQYVYAGASEDTRYFDSIVKVNVNTGETLSWFEKSCYPGEPVFINSPDSKDEDDGVIMSIVLDSENENSFLVILRAKDLKEIGRAIVPHHIPFGLHGIYKQN